MFDAIFPKHWTTLQRLMWLKTNALARAVYETITGNPVSFTAKAAPLRQLKVAFSPVQSLNGYDAPWPAGGGKNKLGAKDSFNIPLAAQGVTLSAQKDTSEFTMTGTLSRPLGYRAGDHYKTTLSAGTYTFSCDVEASGAEGLFIYDVDTSSIIARSNKNASESFILAEETTISLGINFPTTIAAGTFHIQLELGSTATSYAPYSNICPISGWDSVTVEQRGKNLFSGEKLENASISASGTLENNNSNDVLIARVFEGETYTFSLNPSGVTVGGFFTDYPTMDSVTYNNARLYLSGSESYTYTIPQGVKYIGVRYLKTFTEYQIVLGYTLPAEYTPYNGRSISISLGSTVYSGYVDVLNGVLRVIMASVDLGTLTWDYYNGVFYSNIAGKAHSNTITDVICSAYACVSRNATGALDAISILQDKQITGYYDPNSTNSWVYIKDSSYTTALSFKTAMGNTQIVYELATPIPIQLTPQEVSSLLGVNNMWSNANGDLTVEYRSN